MLSRHEYKAQTSTNTHARKRGEIRMQARESKIFVDGPLGAPAPLVT